MITLFKTRNKPLMNTSIHDRVNASLIVRLKQYKTTKKLADEFVEWQNKHENKLTIGWRDYVENIHVISYVDYCERFYNGTLRGVLKSSYKGLFKN